MVRLPPSGMASCALRARFISALRISPGSTYTFHKSGYTFADVWIFLLSVRSSKWNISNRQSPGSSTTGGCFGIPTQLSKRRFMIAHASAAWRVSAIKVLSSVYVACDAAISKLATMVVNRLFKSWAANPVIWRVKSCWLVIAKSHCDLFLVFLPRVVKIYRRFDSDFLLLKARLRAPKLIVISLRW